MAKGINNVTLVGRAGDAPEMKYLESGTALATVSMAVNRYAGKDADGNSVEETDWFFVKFWGKTAEVVGEYIKKGNMFGVVGHIEQEKWTTENGDKRQRHVIVGREVVLMQPKTSNGPSDEYYEREAQQKANDKPQQLKVAAKPF